MSEALSELLRPKAFTDLLQPAHIINYLEKMASKKSVVNMLFYGSPGVGKTSAARLLVAALGDDCVEFSGSRDTGVDLVRRVESAAGSYGLYGGQRVCFLDEADKFSKAAQVQLRGVIENVGKHSRFVMTANNIRQFDRALKSRCMPICFDILASEAEEVIARAIPRYTLRLRDLGVSLNEGRIEELFRLHFPDLRALANRIELEALCAEKGTA